MKRIRRIDGVLMLAAVFALLWLAAGCDIGPDTSEVETYFTQNPVQLPDGDLSSQTLWVYSEADSLATKELANDADLLVLAAAGGSPPYSWGVHDIALGSIVEDRGGRAVYQRNAVGDNVVIVRDSTGAEAYFVVTQP